MPFNLRKRTPLSYYEPDEPKFDEYLYCEECADFVYDYCAIHGPLLVVPDDKVPAKTGLPSYVPRAALTIPNVFLHLAPSIIPGAGLGVFSTLTLPRGVRFGPYRGQRTHNVDSMYCWQIYTDYNRRAHVIDAADSNSSNWMRYVNCARHWKEQNLLAYQYKGQLYYRTIKIIPRFTELMVFYGSEFANALHINLTKYNNTKYYGEVTRTPNPLRTKKTVVTKCQEFLTEEHFDIIDEEIENNDSNQTLSGMNTKTIELKNLEVSETKVQDPTPMEIEKFETPMDKTSIENFQFFKINDDNPSKSTITSETTQNNTSEESSGKNLRQCEFCEKIMSRKHYSSHRQKHLNPNRFACSFCPYTTFRKYAFNLHLSIHTKNYKYACDLCDFKTSYGRNLRLHRARHENRVTGVNIKPPINQETEKICKLCGFKTASRKVIEIHRRKHRVVKHSCDLCPFSTFHKYSLKRHRRTVHPPKQSYPYPKLEDAVTAITNIDLD